MNSFLFLMPHYIKTIYCGRSRVALYDSYHRKGVYYPWYTYSMSKYRKHFDLDKYGHYRSKRYKFSSSGRYVMSYSKTKKQVLTQIKQRLLRPELT